MSYASELEQRAKASGRSPLDVLEFFLERAAIREYEGGVNRAAAEIAALVDVDRWIGAAP